MRAELSARRPSAFESGIPSQPRVVSPTARHSITPSPPPPWQRRGPLPSAGGINDAVTRFLMSTNGSRMFEEKTHNGNGSPLSSSSSSSSSSDDEGRFLIDPLLPFPASTPPPPHPASNRTQLPVGGGGYPASPEVAWSSDGVWTPEVIFRVSTIAVVMALTLVGNTALISAITCHASLRRKRVSVFLLNLAVADLMVCVVTMTTEILFVAFGEWVLGAVACKAIVYGQIVTLASTTFLLTAMSIDRYQVLVKPLQSLRGSPRICRKMALSWILALIFATPQLFIFVQTEERRPTDGQVILTCKSAGYTDEWQRKLYLSFMTSYILLVPTAIMSFCYISIIRIVWLRTGGGRRPIDAPKIHFVTSRKAPAPVLASVLHLRTALLAVEGGGARSDPRRVLTSSARAAFESKRTVVKMTLSVIVGFVVCWTPYFAVSLVRIFSDYRITLSQALSVSEIMALAHSALNPVVYMVFSTRALRNSCCKVRHGLSSCVARRQSRRPPPLALSPERCDWKKDGSCRRVGPRKWRCGTDVGVERVNPQQTRNCRRTSFLTYTRRFFDSDNTHPPPPPPQQQQQGIQLFHPVVNGDPFQEGAQPLADGRTRTTVYAQRHSSNQSDTRERSANIDYYT